MSNKVIFLIIFSALALSSYAWYTVYEKDQRLSAVISESVDKHHKWLQENDLLDDHFALIHAEQ